MNITQNRESQFFSKVAELLLKEETGLTEKSETSSRILENIDFQLSNCFAK